MPAHIRGCDAEFARSVDQDEPAKKTSIRSSNPAEEDARPRITALTQPYMLTIRAGGRST